MKGERDERARAVVLAALASGQNVTAAARAAGVARQTPYQWADRGDLEMRDAIAAAKRGRPADAPPPIAGAPAAAAPPVRAKLHKDERLALETLRAVAEGRRDGEGSSPSAHVNAAKALLEHHRKRRQDAQASKIGAPPPTVPQDRPGGEDLGALITRLSG